MLEFLLSIVNGFGTPLRKEHLITLKSALIPLHKMDDEPTYHDRLQYCMVLFASKDRTLIPVIISEILRLWPKSGSRNKIVNFLAEIDELLEMEISHKIIDQIRRPLMEKIFVCVQSYHSDIVLRTLHLIQNNLNVRKMISHDDDTKLKAYIEKSEKNHWNNAVRDYSSVVLGLLS